jgi:hypothetical protein
MSDSNKKEILSSDEKGAAKSTLGGLRCCSGDGGWHACCRDFNWCRVWCRDGCA